MKDLLNKRTLIVGLGKTGLSCARYLSNLGVNVAVTDTREKPPGLVELNRGYPDIATFLGGFESSVFESAEQLVVSPGIAISHPLIQKAIDAGANVIGDIEIFVRVIDKPIIAITGSNGKSTVTAMLEAMGNASGLVVRAGGNYGTPALDLINDRVDCYILELSSFQLETTRSLQAACAVVLNVSADHMDRYDSFEQYVETKSTIYSNAKNIVCNLDENTEELSCINKKNTYFYSVSLPVEDGVVGLAADNHHQKWMMYGSQSLMPVSDFNLPGTHNLSNALAAWAMGLSMNWSIAGMAKGLAEFKGLPHRTQFVSDRLGVRWYNDSKATNPGATIAALNGFENDASRIILIAGGEGKDADFSVMSEAIKHSCHTVVLIGEDAEKIAAVIDDSVAVVFSNTMIDAVASARIAASTGDVVLLSPACASFDMFDNYQQRGDHFIDAVMRLCENVS